MLTDKTPLRDPVFSATDADIAELPPQDIWPTPRLLMADAYTIGSNDFESKQAQEKSVYYITFRRLLHKIDPFLYNKGDDRLVFIGLKKLLNYILRERITMAEIEATDRFLEFTKISTKGLKRYSYPREIWVKVVNEFNGRPPIKIKALPEGSVFYPNEPVVEISCDVPEMGVLAAWFEDYLLMVWSASEFVTQNEHWLMKCKEMVCKIHKSASREHIDFLASTMLHDFGARASSTPQETEWLGEYYLYTFGGTDTFAGGYQAWKNSGERAGIAVSVKAMAHRNVQSFKTEAESFRALYDAMEDGDIGSFVADCYSFYDAVEKLLLPLALESKRTGNGKIVVARPDSGNAVEQITWLCRLALKHDLYTSEIIDGVEWRFGTFLKFIEGNGMTWKEMTEINDALIEQGFAPFAWGLYGMGGFKRNSIARDNTSTKYALCAVGKENRPVCKFSEELGKTTLPGPFKLRRDAISLRRKETIAFDWETGEDARIMYFDGTNIKKPFDVGCYDSFITIKDRKDVQFSVMPLTLVSEENGNFPISLLVREKRRALLHQYAPKKLEKNY